MTRIQGEVMESKKSQELKACYTCAKNLPLFDFYEIRSSDGGVRLEKNCKQCKRNRRGGTEKRVKSSGNLDSSKIPAFDIKAEPLSPRPSGVHEPLYQCDGKTVYKEYKYPNGEILQVTKSEFDRVVNLFRMLQEEDQRIKGRQFK